MNNQNYGGIQWIQHHHPLQQQVSHLEHQENDIPNALKSVASNMVENQLIINSDSQSLVDTGDILKGATVVDTNEDVNVTLLVGDDDAAELDQIAAENLIFMARDGQMVNEFITPDETGTGGTTLVMDGDVFSVDYEDDTPQMITEEVVAEDCVEISGEQIIGSNSAQVLLDMAQDEYTALRPYPCDFCSRRFRKKTSLNNHMIAHQNDRPNLCKLCGARFSRRAEIINHFKAHAEEQDANEAAESIKVEQQKRQMDDHYYEQVWQLQERYDIDEDDRQEEGMEIFDLPAANTISCSENSSSAVSPSTSAASAITAVTGKTRGRISRLKPKDESMQYVMVDQEEKPTTSDLDYMDCQNLQPSTAAVKLTQDQSPSHQPVYPVIDDSKPFVCQQCGLAFAREKALVSHVKNHRVESPFECNQCNEFFCDTNSLQDHQKTHQFEESNSEYDPNDAETSQSDSESEQIYGEFYCGECGISFHRQDILRRHTKQHNKKVAVPAVMSTSTSTQDGKDSQPCCTTCGETFAEALDLLAHAEMHARVPLFKCVLCGESFYEESAIKSHLQSRHANEMTANSCILCGKECRDRKALIKHAWDHSREKCHSCSKCGKNFHNKARLKRHMASHRDKSVICEVCHEEFPDGRTLSNHRHSHSATSSGKLFPCHECGKTFGSRSSQQIHVRIHTGERPYGCRFCWKAFADGGTLRKHERIHTGEKPYACSVCPRAFNQRVVLREHIRSHHSGLDATRGTYYCRVCTAEMSSSNELIQHLIQHSDSNTAKQRQPITGPRKYKRRRKLQPHEIAHYRFESKTDNYGTDMDMSDFDMENVDDLLGITESTPTKSTTKNGKSKKVHNTESKRAAVGKRKTSGCSRTAKNALERLDDDLELENNDTNSKQRYDSLSSNSDKLWDTKYLQSSTNSQDDSYKTLFNNVEQGLQSIESLVVNNNNSNNNNNNHNNNNINNNNNNNKNNSRYSNNIPTTSTGPKTRRAKNQSAASLTNKLTLDDEILDIKSTPANRTRKKSSKLVKPVTRPRMIHTEKTHTNASQKRTRSKTYITRTQTSNLDLLPAKSNSSSTTIVDDYEIISPATQPPNQISSSPLHIKQESMSTSSSGSHQIQHLYDAHLLLDAKSLRNPSIVNDLEEILRSPLKSEKGSRHRFTSESSTIPQFLPEDDQIKIEPTSPDLREMMEGQRHTHQRMSSVSPSTSMTTRNNRRRDTANKTRATTKSSSKSSMTSNKLSTSIRNADSSCFPSASLSASSVACKSNNNNSSTSSSYLSYGVDSYNSSVNGGSSNSDVSSTFFSISEVVSAADAAAAAAKAAKAASDKPERKICRVQFECEMCSAVFYDRAQLLEHVHIHI